LGKRGDTNPGWAGLQAVEAKGRPEQAAEIEAVSLNSLKITSG
jgi:hypothetical protein